MYRWYWILNLKSITTVQGRLLLSPRVYWYSRYKAGILTGKLGLLYVSAVPEGRDVRGTHVVQAVQSRPHIRPRGRQPRSLTMHQQADDSSTAHWDCW